LGLVSWARLALASWRGSPRQSLPGLGLLRQPTKAGGELGVGGVGEWSEQAV